MKQNDILLAVLRAFPLILSQQIYFPSGFAKFMKWTNDKHKKPEVQAPFRLVWCAKNICKYMYLWIFDISTKEIYPQGK